MKIGVAVFAYKRTWHLRKVLEGLKKNEGLERIYIFQDGMLDPRDKEEWREVNRVIHQIDWCETVINVSVKNIGLAMSIINGVNKVLEENDAVIVLEDDCVPHEGFLSFMGQCFAKYKDEGRVYSVSGYAWPIDVKQPQGEDAYFCGRISSWGWGTWKDRWEEYTCDYTLLRRMKTDRKMSERLSLWGNDLEEQLHGNIGGESDSWAVFWALKVIEKGGYCVNPYKSLIRNIGFDGTGVHCGSTNVYGTEMLTGHIPKYRFPHTIGVLPEVKKAFLEKGLLNCIGDSGKGGGKDTVLIYGIGNYYRTHERFILGKYKVEAYIDKKKRGFHLGKPIVKPDSIMRFDFERIVIMLKDIGQCMGVARMLLEQGVEAPRIAFGHDSIEDANRFWDKMEFLENGKINLAIGNLQMEVNCQDEFMDVSEIFCGQIFNFHINNSLRNVIIDVGMGIGGSVLYFLEKDANSTVYGFEPFHQTFGNATHNIGKNRDYPENGVNLFNYGLSDKNESIDICFDEKMSCETVSVRRASEILAGILCNHNEENKILKVDCEGEEHAILKDLEGSGILGEFDFIMVAWHYRGKEVLLDALAKCGFSYWTADKLGSTGLIYAYKQSGRRRS